MCKLIKISIATKHPPTLSLLIPQDNNKKTFKLIHNRKHQQKPLKTSTTTTLPQIICFRSLVSIKANIFSFAFTVNKCQPNAAKISCLAGVDSCKSREKNALIRYCYISADGWLLRVICIMMMITY